MQSANKISFIERETALILNFEGQNIESTSRRRGFGRFVKILQLRRIHKTDHAVVSEICVVN